MALKLLFLLCMAFLTDCSFFGFSSALFDHFSVSVNLKKKLHDWPREMEIEPPTTFPSYVHAHCLSF